MAWRRGMAYSQDLRDRVLAYSDAGEAVGEIAGALCVSISYVPKSSAAGTRRVKRRLVRNDAMFRQNSLGTYAAIQIEVKVRPDATLPNCAAGLSKRTRSRPAMD